MRTVAARGWSLLTLAAAGLVLAGTALAGPGGGSGNGPPATPPGQEKKAEPAQPATPAQPAGNLAQPAQAKSQAAEKKAEAKSHGQAKKAEKAKSESQGKSNESHGKKLGHAKQDEVKTQSEHENQGVPHERVTLCHATGSETNPYVVITVSVRAWQKKDGTPSGHNVHQDDGDFVVPVGTTKDQCGGLKPTPPPPPPPGGDVVTTACPPQTVTTTTTVVTGVKHKTGSKSNPDVEISPSEKSAHVTKHGDEKATKTVTSTTTVAGNCPSGLVTLAREVAAGPPAGAPLGSFFAPITEEAAIIKEFIPPSREEAQGGVAGVSAKLKAPKKAEKAGGVLGAAKTLGRTAARGRLPFTGIPLWTAALAGLALVATGLLFRRRGALER